MFFFLSKALGFLIQPLVWIVVLLILAQLKRFAGKRKRLLALALFLGWFFTNPFLADEAARQWELPALADEQLPAADVAVVLGGLSGWDAQLKRIQFHASADRLWQAIRLQKQGKVKHLILTGGSGKVLHPEEKEMYFVREYLRTVQLDSLVWFEWQSKNTWENAVNSRIIVDKLTSSRRILLITSGFHMRRALACFRAAGYDPIAYPTDRWAGQRKFELDHLLLPSAGAMAQWNMLLREWVGYAAYRVKGFAQ